MRESKDASGHEHDNKGLFTGTGGGGGGGMGKDRYSHLADMSLPDLIKRRDELTRDVERLRRTADVSPGENRGLTGETAHHNANTLQRELNKVHAMFHKKAFEETGDKEHEKAFKVYDKIVKKSEKSTGTSESRESVSGRPLIDVLFEDEDL